jgi:hypothetical protein
MRKFLAVPERDTHVGEPVVVGRFRLRVAARWLIQWFRSSTAMKWTLDLDGLTEGGFAGWEA